MSYLLTFRSEKVVKTCLCQDEMEALWRAYRMVHSGLFLVAVSKDGRRFSVIEVINWRTPAIKDVEGAVAEANSCFLPTSAPSHTKSTARSRGTSRKGRVRRSRAS